MEYLTDEQIVEMYKNLPEDLKSAIFSVEMTEAVKNIGKKYQLHIDKIGALGNETGMVMLGVTHPRDFIPNLSQRLGVAQEIARKIAEEVNTQIFVKVRDSLKKIHGVGAAPTQPPKADEGEPRLGRDEILKEIEKEEIPEILRGTVTPELLEPPHPFEAKTKEEVFRMPPLEKKYTGGDPYHEPIE